MFNASLLTAVLAGIATLAVAGCREAPREPIGGPTVSLAGGPAVTAPPPVRVAIAHLRSGAGASGSVAFVERGDSLVLYADVRGLEPGAHGFHIHVAGDCRAPDFKSAGGHFDPEGVEHGAPGSPVHHAGDLGNVTADAEGRVFTSRAAQGLTLVVQDPTSIVGRAVVVHADADDLSTQPSGDAGARVACGVIEPFDAFDRS